MQPQRLAVLVLAVTLGGGCDGSVGPVDPIEGDIVAGRTAFVEECASCHPSGDGYDLAYFGFSDTTIIRRAVAHVTEATARDIVAYIRSLAVEPAAPHEAVFQAAAGRQLTDDVAFAVNLFGADEWPADLTTQELAAMDPREVPVALPFPRWSSEETDNDWLPDTPFPDDLLDVDHPSLHIRSPRAYLERYHTDHRTEDAVFAVITLRYALTRSTSATGSCSQSVASFGELSDAQRVRACFNAFRWIASFAAQHVLRDVGSTSVPEAFHQAWWDVGNTLGADDATSMVEHAALNHSVWTYLAWTFAPEHERGGIVYETRVLASAGFPRHATFNSLRGMVARWDRSIVRYADLEAAARNAPSVWQYRVVRFGYEHLLSLLEAGVRPYDPLYPSSNIRNTFEAVAANLTEAQAGELEALRDQIITLLLN